jgi:hypothetical protein
LNSYRALFMVKAQIWLKLGIIRNSAFQILIHWTLNFSLWKYS